jgi:NADH-quinone oxidoreductase subunit M
MYRRVAQGPLTDNVKGFVELVPREAWAIAPVLALTIVLGVFPQAVFRAVNPTVERILSVVDAPELSPSVPASQGEQP